MKRYLVIVLAALFLTTGIHARGVVSLLPSLTDMVVDLESADQLTGVTRYCIIRERPGLTRLGGMYDLNVEALVKLEPDLVLAYRGGERALAPLSSAGVRVRFFAINTLEDVLSTYLAVGRELGKEELANTRVNQVRRLLQPVRMAHPPRILVIMGAEGLERGPVYAAGHSVYGELVSRLGADNAVVGPAAYPSLDREGLITLHPDIILLITEHKVEEPAETGMLSLLSIGDSPSIINVYGATAMHPGPSLFQLIPNLRTILEAYASDPIADLSRHLVLH